MKLNLNEPGTIKDQDVKLRTNSNKIGTIVKAPSSTNAGAESNLKVVLSESTLVLLLSKVSVTETNGGTGQPQIFKVARQWCGGYLI